MSEVDTDEVVTDEEQAAEETPKKKRRLFPSSPAGKASCLTTLFLLIMVVTAWIVFVLNPEHLPWRHSMSVWRVLAQLALVIVIPLVLYRAVKLWLEGDQSRHPDIDYAWQAGIDALEAGGMTLKSAPMFLIAGCSDERTERAIMRATQLDWRVQAIPEGPAPLHWYANPDGIYLFCNEASWLSGLTTAFQTRLDSEAEEEETGVAELDDEADVEPPEPPPPPVNLGPAPSAGGSSSMGTIMVDQFVEQQSATPAGAGLNLDAGASSRGTVTFQSAGEPAATRTRTESRGTASVTDDRPPLMSSTDATTQTQRLRYVCQLIRRGREPVCGINGVLTLLPINLLKASSREAEELKRAVQGDLTTLQRELTLRCPVTALVTGMEEEQGFRELVRRVGRARSANQRFGRRFDVRCEAVPNELRAFTSHVCGAFEDWIYTLFREETALTHPGNTRLYGLLCQVRCRLKTRLSDILSGSYGYREDQTTLEAPVMFSGCYFAATGRTQDRQAFVKAVFEKMGEEQEEIEWTAEGLRRTGRQRTASLTGWLVAGVSVLTLAVLIVRRMF